MADEPIQEEEELTQTEEQQPEQQEAEQPQQTGPIQDTGPEPDRAQRGNGRTLVTPPGSTGVGMVQRTVTDRAIIPAQQSAIGAERMPPRINPRAIGAVQFTRKRIDELALSNEAFDLEISFERYAPTHYASVILPIGQIFRCPLMPFGQLEKAIADAWGGGFYRLWLIQKSTGSFDTRYLPMMIEVNMQQNPPKFEMGSTAKPQSPEEQKQRLLNPVEAEEAAINERMRLDRLETQELAVRNRKLKAQAEGLAERKQIEKMLKTGSGGEEEESKLDKLAKALEEQQKKSEEKFNQLVESLRKEKEQTETDKRISSIERSIEKLTELMSKPRDEGSGTKTLELLIQGMQSQTNALLQGMQQTQAATAAAMAGNQGKSDEVVKVLERVAQMNINAKSSEGEKQTDMFDRMLNMMSKGKNDGESMLALIRLGQDMQAQTIKTMRDLGLVGVGGGGGGGEDEDEGGHWDPKQGTLGNVGKLIFYGLKALANRAVEDPSTLTALAKLTGLSGQQMDDQHLQQAATRLASQHQGVLPGPQQQVYRPQQQGQQPMVFVTPPPQQPRMIQQPPQQQAQQAPVVFRTESPIAAAATQQQTPASALPPTGPATSTVSAATQVTIQPDAGSAASEAIGDTAPPAQDTAEQGEPVSQAPQTPVDEESEERLRTRVEAVMKMALEDLKDGIEAHEWPTEAKATWNKTFLRALAAEQDEKKRLDLIQSKCEIMLWDEITGFIHDEAGEGRKNFISGVKVLVELVNQEQKPQP